MKRLIRKAFGKTIWHGTNLERFQSIVESGMISPNEDEGAGPISADESLFDGYGFFATDFNVAKTYAGWSSKDGNPGVVIEVDVSEDALLPDDNDSPNARTWQESEKLTKQVKVVGPITTNFFKSITFFNGSMKKVIDTPFIHWQENFEKHRNEILPFNGEKNTLKKKQQEAEKIIDKMYSEGLYASYNFDNPSIFYCTNGKIREFRRICIENNLSSQIVGYLTPNGDLIYGNDWPTQNHNIKFTFEDCLFIESSFRDIKNNISNIQNFNNSLKNALDGVQLEIEGLVYSLEEFLEIFNRQEREAKLEKIRRFRVSDK